MTRKRAVVLTGEMTREDADHQLAEFAQADAETRKIEAQMDLKFAKIRETNAEKLNALNFKREQAFEKLKYYADTNKDQFEKRKSIEMAVGKIGFRTGTPKIKLLKKTKWADVIAKIKEDASLKGFLRVKEDVDKEKLIAERTNEDFAPTYSAIGVEVIQDEAFYVEPKEEGQNV